MRGAGADPAAGGLRSFPPVLGQGAASFTPDPAALDIFWRIVTDLFSGLVAPGKVPTPFKAVVQRLKYQHSYTDIGRLCDLVESASGRWSQLGYRLDRYREMARGPFAAQGLADIFALLRSEERRVGKECVSPCRSRWAPSH